MRDGTAKAPLIVLGGCGDKLVYIQAPNLAQRHPHRSGQLPPELSSLCGKSVGLDVRLPYEPTDEVPAAAPALTYSQSLALRGDSLLYSSNSVMRIQLATSNYQFTLGQASDSPSSSNAKGKDKIPEPFPFQNPQPTFRIEPSEKDISSVSVDVNLSDVSTAHFVTLSSPSKENPLDKKPLKDVPISPAVAPIVQTEKLPIKSITSSCKVLDVPIGLATPNLPFKIHCSATSSPSGVSSSSPPLRAPIANSMASTPPFWSPSASLLLSPLAKVKVEKLDVPTAGDGLPHSHDATIAPAAVMSFLRGCFADVKKFSFVVYRRNLLDSPCFGRSPLSSAMSLYFLLN